MMNKRLLSAFLVVMILVSASGCQLAIEDKGEVKARDRLIGVFITDEYLDLFDTEKFLNDNAGKFFPGGLNNLNIDYSKYQKRLYATLVPKAGEHPDAKEYVFEGVDGIPFYAARVPADEKENSYITTVTGKVVCDVHTSFILRDDEDSIILEGTVYVTPDTADTIYQFNPVYQSHDGKVYVVSGNSARLGYFEDEGATFSKALDEKVTVTENGISKTVSSSVKVTMTVVLPPNKISVLEMDKDSNVISRTNYSPGKLPDTITPSAVTEYILVESHSTDADGKAVTSRSVYGRKDNHIKTFYCRDNGICIQQWTNIDWDAK
ncbi:MAG TPA: hypothetical protein GX501_02835 [Clostridiaceae bacterium]|mgnify:CR=1 FL=1|nr:hypothetical protein [Clostridiaceae bacterium]